MTRKSYKFKLFHNKKRAKRLTNELWQFWEIWNECVSACRKHYKKTGKMLSKNDLQKHLKQLIDSDERPLWGLLGYSQGIQDVTDRIYKAYDAFFRWAKTKKGPKKSPPKFKKFHKQKSYTLKQAGWKVDREQGIIYLAGYKYRYNLTSLNKDENGNRIIPWFQGTIKTVTIKRDSVGDWYVIFSCEVDEKAKPKRKLTLSNNAGHDFGLKTFYKSSENVSYSAPEPLKKSLVELTKKSRNFSKKQKGSKNQKKARKALARLHRYIANARLDFQWKLTLALALKHDYLCFETLNIEAMKRIWGRKVSDLAPSQFMTLMEYRCQQYGSMLIFVDRFFPSSKMCSQCGHTKKELSLKERTFVCEKCGLTIDRDLNAAINIKSEGMSSLGLDRVRRSSKNFATVA